MKAAEQLALSVGTSRACQALSVARASFYRRKKSDGGHQAPSVRPCPIRALGEDERQKVLGVLHSDRFVDNRFCLFELELEPPVLSAESLDFIVEGIL